MRNIRALAFVMEFDPGLAWTAILAVTTYHSRLYELGSVLEIDRPLQIDRYTRENFS